MSALHGNFCLIKSFLNSSKNPEGEIFLHVICLLLTPFIFCWFFCAFLQKMWFWIDGMSQLTREINSYILSSSHFITHLFVLGGFATDQLLIS